MKGWELTYGGLITSPGSELNYTGVLVVREITHIQWACSLQSNHGEPPDHAIWVNSCEGIEAYLVAAMGTVNEKDVGDVQTKPWTWWGHSDICESVYTFCRMIVVGIVGWNVSHRSSAIIVQYKCPLFRARCLLMIKRLVSSITLSKVFLQSMNSRIEDCDVRSPDLTCWDVNGSQIPIRCWIPRQLAVCPDLV